MPRLIDADTLTAILEEWEEKACNGTENDGSDGTTRVLHPVPTTTREMIDLIADQPTIEAEPASEVEELMLAMADMNAKFAEEKLAFLKLCPFCGGEARVQAYYRDYAIYCYKCNASTRKFYPTREQAERAWNRRVSDG